MQISHRVLVSAILALTSFASSAIAGVLTVAPTGAQYTQIQTAVNAAGPDDVILIGPGAYSAVTIDGKGLTLIKQGTADISILGTTTVRNLSASQRVVLSGLRGFGQPSAQYTATDGMGLLIENNAGNVRVEYCSFFGAIGWWDNTHGPFSGGSCGLNTPECKGRNGAVLFQNTAGVSFGACELRAGRGADAAHTTIWECGVGNSERGGDGLLVVATLASLYDTFCIGGRGGSNGTVGGAGGAGCRTTAGTSQTGVFASATTFAGGNGGDAWDYFNSGAGAGGTGLIVGPSTGAHLLAQQTFGGWGGVAFFGGFPPGANGAPMSSGGSIFTVPESALRMTTDRVAHAGSRVNVRVQGTPGQVIYLRVSPEPTFKILPSWHGTLLSLRSPGSEDTLLGTIPASGILQRRFLVPELPAGATSSIAYVQAYRADPVLGPKLSAGTSITLLR